MLLGLRHCLVAILLSGLATVVSAQSEYRIRSGDTISIEVLEDTSLNRSVVVLPDGRFSFPFAGSLKASGRTVGQIKASVTSAIASNFAGQPTVFVAVVPKEREPRQATKPRTIDIYFLGEVNAPGLKELAPGTTLLQALAQSGGLTQFAATKRIQLRRTDAKTGQPAIINFNYKALTQGANVNANLRLKSGDVILVPERRLFE